MPSEGGAMMPSAPCDDAWHMLGTKPNIRWKSKEWEHCCPAGGKDWADSEQIMSGWMDERVGQKWGRFELVGLVTIEG
jgi:hypothetical protein